MKRGEGASMNPKRRLQAVFLSALLVFACLTAIPAPSEALPIKWLLYPPVVGDPDSPGGNGYTFSAWGYRFFLTRLPQGPLVLIAVSGTRRLVPTGTRR